MEIIICEWCDTGYEWDGESVCECPNCGVEDGEGDLVNMGLEEGDWEL